MEYISKIIQYIKITNIKIINTIYIYIVAVLCFTIILCAIKILIFLLTRFIENIIEYICKKIFKFDTKLIEYSFVTVWFIKMRADVEYFLDWLNFVVVKSFTIIGYSSNESLSLAEKVKMFSLDNILQFTISIFKYIFSFKWIHVIIAIMTVYFNYIQEIVTLWNNILVSLSALSKVDVGGILDIFQLLIIVFTIIYIGIDVRHKIIGYESLREERFKELFLLEEKMLRIMQRMSYELGKNIEVLIRTKYSILMDGASVLLNGNNCYWRDGHLKIDEYRYGTYLNNKINNTITQFVDMDNDFSALKELNEEFKESSLSKSNVYFIDHQAMLTRLTHFWWIGVDENVRYKKMLFLSQKSMNEWFNNWFIKEAEENLKINTNLSKEEVEEIIIGASTIIDYELQEAFKLEMHLRRYERKMIKRIKKINSFSRFFIIK